jgi:hypothetical protein
MSNGFLAPSRPRFTDARFAEARVVAVVDRFVATRAPQARKTPDVASITTSGVECYFASIGRPCSLRGRADGDLPEQAAHRVHHPVMPLAQQCSEDVLAQLVAPQVIAAVAARVRRGVQVHPVVVLATGHVVPPIAHPLALQQEAPPQPVEVHPTHGIEVDLQLLHHVPCSQSNRSCRSGNTALENTE